jgi:hypothetical protein
VTVYSYLQSVGIINDHERDCFVMRSFCRSNAVPTLAASNSQCLCLRLYREAPARLLPRLWASFPAGGRTRSRPFARDGYEN